MHTKTSLIDGLNKSARRIIKEDMKEALLSLEKRDKISIHRPADTQDVIQSGKDTFVLQYTMHASCASIRDNKDSQDTQRTWIP
jgi:hypothetical protein